MTPAQKETEDLIGEMLTLLRRDFYPKKEKEFFQDKRLLLKAITCPADWMKEHGVAAPASKYRAILHAVISTLKRHASPAKKLRFSAYLLHCVQEHMKHHGDEYYTDAKQVRDVGSMVSGVLRSLEALRADSRDATEMLVALRRTLRSKGGRKKLVKTFSATPDLFESAEPQSVPS
jgi:hypothetical protein